LINFEKTKIMATASLSGAVTWVVGGIGLMGRGICHALLRSGATVIVNSRSIDRLDILSEELGHPDKLMKLHASMMPGDAKQTVATVMERMGGKIDHVVAHSAVRWWASDAGDDGAMANELSTPTVRLLDVSPAAFSAAGSTAANLHFAAAHFLIPRISEGGSYTFVTGGGSEGVRWGKTGEFRSPRGPLAQINAHGVFGLCAALREDLESSASPIRSQELRIGLRLNRPQSERRTDPRDTPMSIDIGTICAGIAARRDLGHLGLLAAATPEDIRALKARFPVEMIGYTVNPPFML